MYFLRSGGESGPFNPLMLPKIEKKSSKGQMVFKVSITMIALKENDYKGWLLISVCSHQLYCIILNNFSEKEYMYFFCTYIIHVLHLKK